MTRPILRIDERPASRWETLLYAWQHTLVDISPFVLPLAIASALGMSPGEGASLINYGLVAMGLATLLQTTFGNRLPIIQGPSATLTGTLAPVAAQLGAPAMWGGIFVGALAETALGASGAIGALRRLFPPVVSGAVVVAIGVSLGQLAVRLSVGDGGPVNFLLAGAVMITVVALQRFGQRALGGVVARGAVFLSIWLVGLGVGGALGMVDWALVASREWFQLPRPFPYGGPGFGWQLSIAAALAIFAGYVGSMVESIGDYLATCEVAGVELERRHVDRGITAEGAGCLLATCLGGLPCTSYTQNVGIIAATGVASRHVVRVAACILLLYGLCPKFGALLVALPRPVLGGVFVLVCGMIVMSGVRLLGTAAPTAGNSLVGGVSLIVSIGLPAYVGSLGEAWLSRLPDMLRLLSTNPVVLAVAVAVALNLLVGDPGDGEGAATG